MVWSKEAGACAGSVWYPPSWETTKNACFFVLFFHFSAVDLPVQNFRAGPKRKVATPIPKLMR